MVQKGLKKGGLICLVMVFLIGKRSPSLTRIKEICRIEFKIRTVAGKGNRVDVTHQIF